MPFPVIHCFTIVQKNGQGKYSTVIQLTKTVILRYNNKMLENRKNPRFRTLALARIPGILEGENSLKDISITGCCIECSSAADLQPDTQYQMEIEPESASHIGSFQLMVEQKWICSKNKNTEIGFIIKASPKGKQFQYYIDYLAYRNSNL